MAIAATILKLNKPFVAISLADPILDITSASDGVSCGVVEAVWYGCLSFVAGDQVVFNRSGSEDFTMSGTQYFIVDEKNIYFTQQSDEGI